MHAVTVPLFMAGTCALALAAFSGAWLLGIALPAMLLPVALQGRAHRLEAVAPIPFRGPVDVAVRLFVEQWITFPRFVLGGGFARQWHAAASGAEPGAVTARGAPRH